MTKDDLELLFIDLSARLPFGLKLLHVPSGTVADMKAIDDSYIYCDNVNDLIENFKPYLRTWDSLTCKEIDYIEICDEELYLRHGFYQKSASNANDMILTLHRFHVDYRELIQKDLAIKAPDDMYEKIDYQY